MEYDGWAFNLHKDEPLIKMYETIPKNIDVLITHQPPLYHGDKLIQC